MKRMELKRVHCPGDDWTIVIYVTDLYGKPFYSCVSFASSLIGQVEGVLNIAGTTDMATSLTVASTMTMGVSVFAEDGHNIVDGPFCEECWLPLWVVDDGINEMRLCPFCDQVE